MYFRTPHSFSYFSDSFASGFSPLFSVIYISAASHLLVDAELEALVTESGENNSDLGVTGLLLYYEGAFLQLLEGTQEVVRGLYERIALDPRHQDVTLLLEEYIGERAFPEWSMGCHRLSDEEVNRLEGFAPNGGAAEFLAYFQEQPEKAMPLLQSVRQSASR